jgi:hypothetical protein
MIGPALPQRPSGRSKMSRPICWVEISGFCLAGAIALARPHRSMVILGWSPTGAGLVRSRSRVYRALASPAADSRCHRSPSTTHTFSFPFSTLSCVLYLTLSVTPQPHQAPLCASKYPVMPVASGMCTSRKMWILLLDSTSAPTTTVTLPQDIAWRLFTKGSDRGKARALAVIEGRPDLADPIFATTAILG